MRSEISSLAPSWASHVLTGDYFAGKLANTRANTRADTLRPKKYHQLQYKVGPTQPLKTEGQLSEIIISLSLKFLSSFSRIFCYFLDIQARVERRESESSESKDIELVEEISGAVQGCSSLWDRH